MRKILILLLFISLTFSASAQNSAKARAVLDKTAQIVGRKGGAYAEFSIGGGNYRSVSGKLAIKGRKFQATTPQAIVWYDGKTQYTLMRKTNEVNITIPSQAQRMKMNPYTFLNLYKAGYNLSMTTKGSDYNVHLVAKSNSRSVKEVYILVDSKTYAPQQVKMKQGSQWTTINIRNFQARNQPNSVFTFRAKDFPNAEIIDLR